MGKKHLGTKAGNIETLFQHTLGKRYQKKRKKKVRYADIRNFKHSLLWRKNFSLVEIRLLPLTAIGEMFTIEIYTYSLYPIRRTRA